MRKQYHLRTSVRGLLAWDVDRLIELSSSLPHIQVPLDSIRELDEPFWFAHGETPTCRAVAQHSALIEAADLAFPIILCSEGRLMDGMHRVAKAAMHGLQHIEAVRFASPITPDFVDVDPSLLPYDTPQT